MTRKFVNFCLALALVWGCCGSVLAAVCPHLSCETKTAAPIVSTTRDAHVATHCHDAVTAPAVEPGSNNTDTGHVTEASGERQEFARAKLSGTVARPHEGFCAHCVGRPGSTPSVFFEPEFNAAKKNVDFAAPHAVAQTAPPSDVFRRKITPAQHAPPACSGKQLLLLNVFRI